MWSIGDPEPFTFFAVGAVHSAQFSAAAFLLGTEFLEFFAEQAARQDDVSNCLSNVASLYLYNIMHTSNFLPPNSMDKIKMLW